MSVDDERSFFNMICCGEQITNAIGEVIDECCYDVICCVGRRMLFSERAAMFVVR